MGEKQTVQVVDDRTRRALWQVSFSARRLVLIGYMALMFLTTHIPLIHAATTEDVSWLDNLFMGLVRFGHGMQLESPDKWFHFCAYLLLGLLAFWAAASYGRQRNRATLGLFCASGWLIFSALLLWGLFDELTQPMFGRGFDWNDYLANAMGLFLAATLAALPWLSAEIKSICSRRASPGQ